MSALATGQSLPLLGLMAGFRRFSVAEYHRMIGMGVLTEDDDIELIEGYLVQKLPRNPPHDGAILRAMKTLTRHLPAGWDVRIQSAFTLSGSEPEPDLAVVREEPSDYTTRHPAPADTGLLVEVADSSLQGDRLDKGRIYARDLIAEYWIINIPDRQIEVYTQPPGPAAAAAYGHRQDYRPGDRIPLRLAGTLVATLDVRTLLG